jgi:predicted RND superfamily exporter protein
MYLYFKRHKVLFYAVFLSTTAFFAWFSLKINFEEDISKLLPSTEKGGAEELVFSNLKVKEKIFILFHSPSGMLDPDGLIAVCDEFTRALWEKDTVYNAINDILYRIDEDVLQDGIGFLYEHVPVFLDNMQYESMDSLCNKEHVAQQMDENYATLISPAGMAFKDMIVKDPIAMRKLFISNINNIGNGLGGDFIFYQQHIFTKDTSIVLAFLSPRFKSFDSKQSIRLAEIVEQEIENFQQQNSEIEILYHGAPVQSVYNSRRIKMDLLLTISISLTLIGILLLFCFKNKSTLLYLILPVAYGVLFSMSTIYLIKGSMSLMSMGIGAVVMGVAFSYCLHVLTHYKYVSDPKKVLRDQTVPVILGSLTTIGAFAGLLLTKSELLQDFGLFASLGLVGTTLFCLFFLPQLFHPKTNRKSEKAFIVLEKINSYPLEKKKWLITLIIVVSVLCFAFSGQVKFDFDLQHIGYHQKRVVRSNTLLASKATDNLSTVYFAAVSEQLDSALIAARRLCNKMDKLIENNKIQGYSAAFSLFVPTGEQQKRIDHWNEYWTDAKKADIRQKVTEAGRKYKFADQTFTPFFELLDAEYEPVSLYDAGIIPKEILNNIIEYTDNRYLVFIPVRMDRALLVETGDYLVADDPQAVVVDPMYYTGNMVRLINDDFNIILGISSLFVLIVLLLSYKSVVLVVLAFLPMCLSWYIVLGTMAIFGISFNLINIVISSFIFGIGVDYSIFIMDGLLATYRTRAPLLMYHKTAILFSAVILIIVVVSLLFAVHPAISSIGVSTLIGMVATIFIAYSLQPFLFALLITNRTAKGKAPIALCNLFLWCKKTPERVLKNNYLYKGNAVNRQLTGELAKTNRYALLGDAVKGHKNLLDYRCGHGFCSYWASLTDDHIKITGFDANHKAMALADNGYLKTDRMQFTINRSALNAVYDVVFIQKSVLSGEAALKAMIANAQTIILRNELMNKYRTLLEGLHFKETGADELFVVVRRQTIF